MSKGITQRLILLVMLAFSFFTSWLSADIIFLNGNVVNQSSGAINYDTDNDNTIDIVMDTNNNLGISTLSPTSNLHVAGNVQIDEHLSLLELGSVPDAQLGNSLIFSLSGNLFFMDGAGTQAQVTNGAQTGAWSVSGDNVYRDNGNIGVGTSSPDATIETVGNIYLNGGASVSHFMTSWAPTDVFGVIGQETVTVGGLRVWGFADTTNFDCLELGGFNTADNSNNAYVKIRGGRRNGSTIDEISKDTTLLAVQNNLTTMAVIMASGNLGILTTSPNAELDVNGNTQLGGNVWPSSANTYNLGSLSLSWNDVFSKDFTNMSDRRLKDNIENLDKGMDEIMRLRPVSYSWKGESDENRKYGLIAQEVKSVLEEAVKTGEDARQTLGIHYSNIVPVLIKGMQEQQREIQLQKNKNTALLKVIEELRHDIDKIKNKLE